MVNPTGNSREYRTGYFRVAPEQTPSVGSLFVFLKEKITQHY